MSTSDNELLYKAAVEWIKQNPDTTGLSKKDRDAFLRFKTLSPEDKGQLVLTLLKTTGLAEEIKLALPWLAFDFQEGLPDNELLYKAVVEWIKQNPDTTGLSKKDRDAFLKFKTLSPEHKGQLVLTLLKTTGLAEEIKLALPWLAFNFQEGLYDELQLEIATQNNKFLYKAAGEWIKQNPDTTGLSKKDRDAFLKFKTLSPEDKGQLLLSLLKTTGLAEEIKLALPWLAFDFQGLPNEVQLVIATHLEKEPDRSSFVGISKATHSLFQPKYISNSFLQKVAFGQQDKAEQLFTNVYKGKPEKIQKALLYQGRFTDYSGRTFHCSAYEYAYWAKDTYMCRMLERYMDDATKADMLARVNKIEQTGLSYTQNRVAYCTPHFDFTPLIQALQFYVNNYNAWNATSNWAAMKAAWMNVSLTQRDVPAHVAQEYCRLDRVFYPCPLFNEPELPRILTVYNLTTLRNESWFPLTSSNSGLNFDFGLTRGTGAVAQLWRGPVPVEEVDWDLAAITRLEQVRTADLMLSRKNLSRSRKIIAATFAAPSQHA